MPVKGSKRATARVWQAGPVPFALDLDGVIWLADDPIPGAAEAVARLRGDRRAGRVRHQQLEPAAWPRSRPSWPATGSPAGGRRHHLGDGRRPLLVEPGERVLVCGGPGRGRGGRGARRGRRSRDGDADAVLVGLPPRVRLRAAAGRGRRRCGAGARLLATNDDATYPTPDGPIPGGGAILAVDRHRQRRGADRGRQAARADGRPGAGPRSVRRG